MLFCAENGVEIDENAVEISSCGHYLERFSMEILFTLARDLSAGSLQTKRREIIG